MWHHQLLPVRIYGSSKNGRKCRLHGSRRIRRSRKSWKDNIKEWTGQSISSLLRTADDRSWWAVITAEASVGVPQRRLGVMWICLVCLRHLAIIQQAFSFIYTVSIAFAGSTSTMGWLWSHRLVIVIIYCCMGYSNTRTFLHWNIFQNAVLKTDRLCYSRSTYVRLPFVLMPIRELAIAMA